MAAVFKTHIVKIGNSKGIRIPKTLLEQLNFKDKVELEVQHNQLIVRSPSKPRQDWDEQFRAMARRGDDQLLDSDIILPQR
ncbi:MAG: AbrB/MazE/SpoVT family DNA-binding domain-containing protein [Elainellaceae cyanobacterium]